MLSPPQFKRQPSYYISFTLGIVIPLVYMMLVSLFPPQMVAVFQILIFGCSSFALFWYFGLNQAFCKQKMPQLWAYYALLSFAVSLLLSVANGYWLKLFPMPPLYQKVYAELFHLNQPFGWLIDIALYAAIPALCEELFTRGFLLTSLKRSLSPRRALFITSVLFSLYHLNPWFVPIYFLLGLFFGWIYLRSGNLIAPILAHFINNAYAVSLYHFFGIP